MADRTHQVAPETVTTTALSVATSVYTISRARESDPALLPDIERSSARLLAGYAPESVLAETTSVDVFATAQRRGLLWVALAEDTPIGFALLDIREPGVLHLEELDVLPEHGRRGLGRRLVRTVCNWAESGGFRAVTLTTFRDVLWNMPFYARCGFGEIPPAELSASLRAIFDEEASRGLDPARRVAMRRLTVVS